MKTINGFSKLSKAEKINWLAENFTESPETFSSVVQSWQHPDTAVQRVIDGFTENAISNFTLPYSIAPNFLINGKTYAVPMVIEESSVVAAASSAAKFWQERGGFHAVVLGTVKLGQVHFRWPGKAERLRQLFPEIRQILLGSAADLTENMRKRGGGVLDIELIDFETVEPNYYQLRVSFENLRQHGRQLCELGAGTFMRTALKCISWNTPALGDTERDVEIIMSILSNYTPNCLVRAWAECPISSFTELARSQGMDAASLADRFCHGCSDRSN